jgi:ribosomal protein L3 glutamine methyltransferase
LKRRRAGVPGPPLDLSEVVRATAAKLKTARLVFAHGTRDPLAEAAFMAAAVLGIHPDHLDARAGMRVTAAQRRRIAALADRRIRTREPAAYLVRRIYMRGAPFYIDKRAIVPRSYLGELLDDEVFALLRNSGEVGRVLDLCTGSGCLAVLAALRFPKAKVDAVELSKAALQVARRNVADHGLGRRIRLLHGDLFVPLKGRRYDLIVANPPYVDRKGMAGLPPECRHEPKMAFDGGDDGLAVVRRIVDAAGRHLNEGGGLLCEIGRGRKALERAYPRLPFLWLDTEESSGEVFWLDARSFRECYAAAALPLGCTSAV